MFGQIDIIGKHKLLKLKKKNIGNVQLIKAINDLIESIENADWKNHFEMLKERTDADCVYEDFYFFDIHIHRTFIGIDFVDGEANVVWYGSHDEYEATFKNNKDTIRKWLKSNDWIN